MAVDAPKWFKNLFEDRRSSKSESKYSTFEQPWWANDMLILVFALFSVVLIVIDMETSLRKENPLLWWTLALIDLAMVGFFVADLIEDLSRCNDKRWWWTRNWWEFLGLVPMAVMALEDVTILGSIAISVGMLRWLRILRAFSAIVRLLSTTRSIGMVTVEKQIVHLTIIVAVVVFTGGFMTYVFELDANEACRKSEAENRGLTYPWGPPGSGGSEEEVQRREIILTCEKQVPMDGLDDAMWWALVTTTTVGYGDITPTTGGGKVVAAFLMLFGIGLVGMLAATLSQALYGQTMQGMPPASQMRREYYETLEQVSRLYREGGMTEEEYSDVKSRILQKIGDLEIGYAPAMAAGMTMPMRVAAQMHTAPHPNPVNEFLEDIEEARARAAAEEE